MEIPYVVTARPDTGLWNAKIGIWLFLASEVMLFGGLFASYIFLRLDADYPWPVHVLTIKWGFVNTLVLIFSSVTVLQAWLALKMRKFGLFRVWLFLTVACAGAFMVIKFIEYTDKFHHYGVRLQDSSVLEGHLHNGYYVQFTGRSEITLSGKTSEEGTFRVPGASHGLTIGAQGSDANFLQYLVQGQKIQVEEDGKTVTLDAEEVRSLVKDAWNPAHPKARIPFKVVSDFTLVIPPSKIMAYDHESLTFYDGTIIKGQLDSDQMKLDIDRVDVRRLIDKDETEFAKAVEIVKTADAWKILGDEWKTKFFEHNAEEYEKFHKAHGKQNPLKNADFVRDAFTMPVNLGEAGHEHGTSKGGGGHKAEHAAPTAEGHAEAHEDHGLPIERKDIAFFSNFTPKYNTFFAIYFALTGLHGLHVVGGALVLSYMGIFGKGLFRRNPEHLANRVETAGLFWHFVDLVWIFLFPLLYLM